MCFHNVDYSASADHMSRFLFNELCSASESLSLKKVLCLEQHSLYVHMSVSQPICIYFFIDIKKKD